MSKITKCIFMISFYLLLVMPAFAATNYYISNTPMPAGKNASLGEVWMRHGGARLQYDALHGPVQMNTNGRPVLDPAAINFLPPLNGSKSSVNAKVTTKKSVSRGRIIDKNAPPTKLPMGKKVVKPNSSPKPSVSEGAGPYSGPAVAPTVSSATKKSAPSPAVKTQAVATVPAKTSAQVPAKLPIYTPLPTGEIINRPADPSSLGNPW